AQFLSWPLASPELRWEATRATPAISYVFRLDPTTTRATPPTKASPPRIGGTESALSPSRLLESGPDPPPSLGACTRCPGKPGKQPPAQLAKSRPRVPSS